jgi:hypothetical protein
MPMKETPTRGITVTSSLHEYIRNAQRGNRVIVTVRGRGEALPGITSPTPPLSTADFIDKDDTNRAVILEQSMGDRNRVGLD